jgi:CubicO group peptidase (beta-lactamase class C family)
MVADIEKLMPGLMKEANLPGLSIALIEGGKRVWSRGFGVRDVTSKTAVDADTVFECASISKTVFAYAVMKLCEQGVIDLDVPLLKYWPEPFVESDPRATRITARHILSHQSGLPNWRTDEPLKLNFDPGTDFMYSGEGYFYLQSVLTHLRGNVYPDRCGNFEAGVKVCATDIGEFLQKQVLAPLKMKSSSYLTTDKLKTNYALPHDVQGKVFSKPPQTQTALARYASAGSLLTTANDYAQFIISLFEPKDNDPFRLSKKSIEEMHRPHVKLKPDQQIDGASSWGLGWAIQERPGGNVVLHSGGHSGYRSLSMLSVQRQSGFIMLTNGDTGGRVVYDQALGNILNRLLPT